MTIMWGDYREIPSSNGRVGAWKWDTTHFTYGGLESDPPIEQLSIPPTGGVAKLQTWGTLNDLGGGQ